MPKQQVRDSRIKSAILCDEARPEAGDKLMLLGIYTGDMLMSALPAQIAVAIYLDLDLPKGSHHIHIRLKTDEKIHAGMEGELSVLKTSVAGISTPKLPVLIENETELLVELQIDGGPWTLALKKSVLLASTFEAAREVTQ